MKLLVALAVCIVVLLQFQDTDGKCMYYKKSKCITMTRKCKSYGYSSWWWSRYRYCTGYVQESTLVDCMKWEDCLEDGKCNFEGMAPDDEKCKKYYHCVHGVLHEMPEITDARYFNSKTYNISTDIHGCYAGSDGHQHARKTSKCLHESYVGSCRPCKVGEKESTVGARKSCFADHFYHCGNSGYFLKQAMAPGTLYDHNTGETLHASQHTKCKAEDLTALDY